MPYSPALSLALLAGLAAGHLTACANTPGNAPRELGTLQLNKSLQIEPDAATARLQYGHIVARNAVQEHDPFCVFEIDTVRTEPQTVAPGAFRIVAISHSVETFAGNIGRSAMPVFPFSRTLKRVSFDDDDGPTHIYYKTTFRLQDAQQPAHPPARALTCMSNQNAPGNAAFMRHLTLPEIRGALGSWFSLSLAQ